MRVQDDVKELVTPIRGNDLEVRRRRLGLSRVVLGRILGVDPATVFRHEIGELSPLWDYALRGVEAEFAAIPDQIRERGWRAIAEKLGGARLEHAENKARPSRARPPQPGTNSRSQRLPSAAEIKIKADRAEARAKKEHRMRQR